MSSGKKKQETADYPGEGTILLADDEVIEDLPSLGFNQFLPKPYKPEELIEVVSGVLNQRRQ